MQYCICRPPLYLFLYGAILGLAVLNFGRARAEPPPVALTPVYTGQFIYSPGSTTSPSYIPNIVDFGNPVLLPFYPTCYVAYPPGEAGSGYITDSLSLSANSSYPGGTITFSPTSVPALIPPGAPNFTASFADTLYAGSYTLLLQGAGTYCQYSQAANAYIRPTIALSRSNLLTITATGAPAMGGYYNAGTFVTQPNVYSMVTVVSAGGANAKPTLSAGGGPNATLALTEPPPPAPAKPHQLITSGGLAKYMINYSVAGLSPSLTAALTASNDKSNPFSITTFLLTPYITALQSDYGTPPNNCVDQYGHPKPGQVVNPGGYPGTYCKSFVLDVVLQGQGQLNNGTLVSGVGQLGLTLSPIQSFPAAQGRYMLMSYKTCARSTSIIPKPNVTSVTVDGLPYPCLANDTGTKIIGYHLDIYVGVGKASLSGFNVRYGVGTCSPSPGPACPNGELQ